VIRFTIGQLYTTRTHVERAWRVIAETARKLPNFAQEAPLGTSASEPKPR
jgi:hypothetical protein